MLLWFFLKKVTKPTSWSAPVWRFLFIVFGYECFFLWKGQTLHIHNGGKPCLLKSKQTDLLKSNFIMQLLWKEAALAGTYSCCFMRKTGKGILLCAGGVFPFQAPILIHMVCSSPLFTHFVLHPHVHTHTLTFPLPIFSHHCCPGKAGGSNGVPI